MVLAKFLHGAGTFELGCKQASGVFARKYVGLVRGAIPALPVAPCRRLTDLQMIRCVRLWKR